MIESALMCLALNVYFESRSEPPQGQQAVALVTMNRAEFKKEKVCDVVFAPKQFSWTASSVPFPKDALAWEEAVRNAKIVMSNQVYDFTLGARFFHTKDVSPSWASKMMRVKLSGVGSHYFYKQIGKS